MVEAGKATSKRRLPDSIPGKSEPGYESQVDLVFLDELSRPGYKCRVTFILQNLASI
jgi:hypothetical protein